MADHQDGPKAVVNFGLLGPLSVELDGLPVLLASPTSRILLACLLLRAGDQVTFDELAQAVWSGDEPATPRKALQIHMHRLRVALGSVASAIVTGPDGYRLDVAPNQVDLGRFREHIRAADLANARGADSEEGEALNRALAIWRSTPLLDVPSELLQRQAMPALVEERLHAIERHADWCLKHQVDEAFVRHLAEVAELYPTRERLWEQLIAALHLIRRRTDALLAYHTIRRRLADELGIDPGERLRLLHATILNGDQAHPVPVPRQLPAGVPTLVGRRDELGRLNTMVNEAESDGRYAIGLISGMAGVGKTTLAVYWARQMTDRFPDGQLWLDLRGFDPSLSLSPESALIRMLRALGVGDTEIPVALAEQTAVFGSLLAGRRMLVVLDNAGTAEQVKPLLANAPGCATLVTSRWALDIEVDEIVDLKRFNADDARYFLVSRLGKARLGAGDGDLMRLSAGLPLALALICARAATEPAIALRDLGLELRDTRPFGSGWVGDEMRNAFSWSYRALDERVARLFRLLSVHPGGEVTVAAVASLAEIGRDEATAGLRALCAMGFLDEHGARFSQHDLLRTYASGLAHAQEAGASLTAAVHRLLDYYLHSARAANVAINPSQSTQDLDPAVRGVRPETFPDTDSAQDWYPEELSTLVSMVDLAEREGLDRYVVRLVGEVWEAFGRQAHVHEQLWAEQAALRAGVRLNDPTVQLACHRSLAEIYARLGQVDESRTHLGLAAELVEDLDSPAEAAVLYLTLAKTAGQQERREEALSYAREALSRFEREQDTSGQARALNAIGWHELHLGKHEEAIDHCRAALDLLTSTQNKAAQAATSDTLGLAYLRSGEFHSAVECLARSEAFYRELRDQPNLAEVLMHLAEAHTATGDIEKARTCRHEALAIRESMGWPTGS